MNITSSINSNADLQSLYKSDHRHLVDLRQAYKQSVQKIETQNRGKSRSAIRIKRNLSQTKTNQKASSLPQKDTHDGMIKSTKALHFPLQQPSPVQKQLIFLRELVNQKRQTRNRVKSQLQLKLYSQEEKHKLFRQQSQKKVTKNRLEDHRQLKEHSKKQIEYQHYDTVVKDLLSQIRLRKDQDKRARPIISPHKLSETKTSFFRNGQIESSEAFFRSTIKLNQKKDTMIFRMNQFLCDAVYEKKITSYIIFLYKINFSNSIYVDLSLSNIDRKYKIKIGGGNNCKLLKSQLKKRFWLEFASPEEDSIFYWTQSSLHYLHERQVSCYTLKEKKNANQRYQLFQRNLRKIKHIKKAEQDLLNEKILMKKDVISAEAGFYSFNNGSGSIHPKHDPILITNHIPHNFYIASKKVLFLLLNWYYRFIKDINPFAYLPKTYHIRSGEINNKPFKEFMQKEGEKFDRIWIVKPGENTNQGRGITVSTVNEVGRLIRKKEIHKNGEEKTYIIQQYIKPFLYNGRKFDIRHYLLVTSVNGFIKAYWFKQGYIRTSSEKYDLEDLSNQFVHLTNDFIQKKSEDYGKYQPGNKISYSTFQRYLDLNYPQKKYSFEKQILEKMKFITKDLISASFSFMDPQRKSTNFQLYGMDFLIDSKFKPYLIEVNANPCLETSCPLLERIIPIMLEHTFRIGLDPLLPPPQHYPVNSRYQLNDRFLQKLRYQLIFDEKHEGQLLRESIEKVPQFFLDKKQKLQADEEIFDNDGYELKDIQVD